MSSGIFEENGYRLWWTYFEQPLLPGEASDAARGLLERALPGATSQLQKLPTGKPFLAQTTLKLSISHAPCMVAVALAPFEIGMDVEAPHPRLLRIKDRVFTREECEWAQQGLLQLSALWTAREALYKLDSNRGLDFRRELGTNAAEREGFPTLGHIRRKGTPDRLAQLHYHSVNDHLFCVASYLNNQ